MNVKIFAASLQHLVFSNSVRHYSTVSDRTCSTLCSPL